MQSCKSTQAEEILRLAEQTDDPERFLAQMIEFAKQIERCERRHDEAFDEWKKEHGYE